ncbi:hypothetical protein BGX23_003929 [Mortierella sp. AD031]|nr:hypothetical protein BGX23_003929 [Mortierella sp. AD031]
MEHCLVNIAGDPEATDSVNSVIVPVDDNDDTIIPTDPTPSPAIATMDNNSNDATTSSSLDVSSTPNEPGPGETIAEGSDEGTIAAGTAPSHGPRWFLKPTKLGIPVIDGPMLECTADEQPPVAIEATTRYTQWKMDLRDLPPGDYDLALAVSVQGPMLAKIKSLVLTFHDDLTYIPPNNIIFSGDYLRTLLSQQAEVGATTLKVDAQIQVPVDAERASEPSEYTAVLEIRMLSKDIKDGVQVVEEGDQNLDEGDQSLDDGNLGQLYLHHVQLRRFRPASGLSELEPYLLSLDAREGPHNALGVTRGHGLRVFSKAISSSGRYAVTGAVSRTSICLDVWDLRGVDSYSDDGSLNENIPSTPCASLIADLDLEFRNALHTQCDVSISSDGSWISLLDATTLTPLMPGADATALSLKSVCGIFKFDKESLGPSNLFTPLCRPSINSTHVAELAAYSGYGKFTSLDTTQLRPQDELFVACNGREAKVYSIYQQWSHLRTIQLTSPPATLMEKNIGNQYRLFFGARRLIGSLRGPVFAWTGNADYMVTVYHAGTGSVISAFKSKPYTTEDIVQYAPVEFSRDGLSLAIYGNGIIARHSVATGALLGTFDIPSWVRSVFTLQFIKGDSQILVEAPSKHDSYGAGRLGIVIDAASMSLAAHFLMPGGRIICQGPANRQDSASFYSTRCSKLYLTTMDSCIIDPYTRPEDQCYSRCLSDLTPLGQCPKEFTSSSGLTFRLEIRTTPSRFEGMTQVSPSVVVSIASAQQPIPREAFVIPPMEHKTGPQLGYQCARFLESSSQLVVITRSLISIWSLPSTADGSFSLLLVWTYPGVLYGSWEEVGGPWYVCRHRKLYCTLKDESETVILAPRTETPFDGRYPLIFYLGLGELLKAYEEGDDRFRGAVLDYIGAQMNDFPVPIDPTANLVCCMANSIDEENQHYFPMIAKELLSGKHGAWIPSLDLQDKKNPLWNAYNKAKSFPRVMATAETMIDCCFRQTRRHRDARFLSPVTRTLHLLCDPQIHQEDLALRTLRRLAYFRTGIRQFVLDHYIVVRRPGSRWRFWRSSSKSLLEYKDPILQVDLIAGKPNPKNDTFSLPLFEARFDMLWAFKDQGPIGTPFQPTRRNVLQQLIHWVWVFICMAFHKLWLKSTPYVQSHHFSLDAYENRALEALIEYKWNTIGYRYWLIRFLAQLCYYALILSVVILQITNDGFKELRGLCYFIIASSVVFLWLELVQFFREKGKYTSSLYNVVDLLTFTLPLAASTYHLLLVEGKIAEEDENIGLFSFSILFIALHFLFELRVNKSVCYIVTIIIRAINKIRVFFFIFAFGIITFSTASLHSLRGCYYKSCTQKTIFPSNFYGAFVTVYFLMGGRYDQISDEMNSNNWTFQTLMIVFFFFTVILMLNVLIALINKAFNDGDETWRLVWLENRLRIVEAAEDMSFRIPGFRASHNWFPEVIYYSATHQQVRAFEEKFFGGEDEFLVTGEKGWAEEDRHRPTPLVLMAPTVPVNYSVSQFPSASAKQQTTQELLGDTAGSVLPTIVEATTSGEDLLLQLQQQLQAQEAQNRRMEEKLETLLTIFMNQNPAAPVDVTTTPTMTTTTK